MRSMKRSSDASAALSSSANVSGRTTLSVRGTRSTLSAKMLFVDSPWRYSTPGCERTAGEAHQDAAAVSLTLSLAASEASMMWPGLAGLQAAPQCDCRSVRD